MTFTCHHTTKHQLPRSATRTSQDVSATDASIANAQERHEGMARPMLPEEKGSLNQAAGDGTGS